MNRTDFMTQLERLLQNISPAEREEALQYYNDYFDDAGAENEQEVIEALGNPARVAENIKRDILGNPGENTAKAAPSDRAVIEYGKPENEEMQREEQASAQKPDSGNGTAEQKDVPAVSAGRGNTVGNGGAPGQGGAFGWGGAGGQGGAAGGTSAQGAKNAPAKKGMPGWAIALITVCVIFASPFLLGLAVGVLGIAFGVLMTWLALVFAFGLAALILFIVLAVLVAVGIQCMFVDPLVGIALIGGGLVCGGVGILLLMAAVALTGIVTPAIFRGVGRLFHRRKREAAV